MGLMRLCRARFPARWFDRTWCTPLGERDLGESLEQGFPDLGSADRLDNVKERTILLFMFAKITV